jgi:hypothetical protein
VTWLIGITDSKLVPAYCIIAAGVLSIAVVGTDWRAARRDGSALSLPAGTQAHLRTSTNLPAIAAAAAIAGDTRCVRPLWP